MTKELTALKQGFGKKLGDVGRQAALEAVSRAGSLTAGQALALAQGKVYNPNVELLYTMPSMRGYDFTFSFVPKDPGEAQIVNDIILNFRKWSAPEDIQNGMFEVPHVWEIKYMIGSRENTFMNKFKHAACTNVQVQANPQMSMHVSHPDGAPIETVMTLNFREVNIITREDHEGGQGF